MQKYYYIKTYGCQMNIHESEKLAGMLRSLDYIETLHVVLEMQPNRKY